MAVGTDMGGRLTDAFRWLIAATAINSTAILLLAWWVLVYSPAPWVWMGG